MQFFPRTRALLREAFPRCRWGYGVICVFFFVAVGGDIGAAHADGTVPYRHFKAFDGLPSENITALAQTPDGLLWIGTETGLAVYDGDQMRAITIPDSLGTSYISALHARPDGSVWATPSQGEAVQVSLHGIEQVVELGDRIVQEIVARQDTLFFVTRTAVWRLPQEGQEARRQPFQYDIRPSEVESNSEVGAGVFNAAKGPNGDIWVLDGHRGPGRLHADGSVSFVDAPHKAHGDFWYDIQFADGGTGLVLQGEQLHRFDVSTGGLEPVVGSLGDPTYLSVQGNRAYVTRDQTLLRYDVSARRMHSSLGPAQGLPDIVPSTVFRDAGGGLWIGTSEGLLHLMAPDARHMETIEGVPLVNVAQFLPGEEALWAGTYGTGLVQLHPVRRRVTPDGLFGWRQDIRSLDERLHALASETRAWYRWEGGTDWQQVAQTEGASEGFVGSRGDGFFVHDDGIYRYVPAPDSTPTQLVAWPDTQNSRQKLAPAPNGDLIHRAEETILRRRPSDGAVKDTVIVLTDEQNSKLNQMVVDAEGRIWGAYLFGGVLHADPSTGEQNRPLLGERMWTVEVVGDSLVLAGARQSGLYLIDAHSGAIRRQLTRADGLRSNTVMTAHMSADTLFVGHDNGLTRLPTDELYQFPSSPSSLLTGLEIDLDERSPTADSVLSATERSVGFAYTAPSLAHADQVQFEVRLVPRDTSWDATSRRFVRYTNLEPDTYRFQVRARLGEQPPGPVATHVFTIPPHFYETWWFQMLAVLGLFGLGIGAYRWRTYRLRRRQEELEAAVQTRTEELAKQKRKTERQAERLAELDEAKNRFFAHISHEFRTPLSLILSPLQDALRQGRALGVEQMERMASNTARLRRLIDQLLDLATLEAGGMTLDRRPGDLSVVVERTAGAFRSKAEQEGLALNVQAPSERIEMQFDPEKVETIVTNLVGNALKFTPEGGTVAVRVDRIETIEKDRSLDGGNGRLEGEPTEGAPMDGMVRLEVSDTGPGIEEEVQEQIFDRFEQADNTLTREHEGTGLGLALTKELVELHGGTIEVESTPGEGTTFVVHLPLEPVAREEEARGKGEEVRKKGREEWEEDGLEASADGETKEADETDEERATVLVVEDNAEMRAYLREQLGRRWRILEAADGEEGWAAVEKERPDLVLSDVMMPQVDGVELCRRIKEEEELRSIPVLLLTARAGDDATLQGLGVGADDYIAKPFDIAELRQRIENHLTARVHLRERHREEVHLAALGTVTDEADVPFVEEAVKAIEERLNNPDFTVGRLAEAMALSRRQLARRLKEAIGETPGALIRQRRIERAKGHLDQGAETIAEVAYATGFRSPSAFSQAFKEEVGVSPSNYRQREGANE